MHSKYLIVGSSHAALEAATAIRLIDADGALTLLTRDAHLPYSPTILPYVVSGRSQPDNVVLRNKAYFKDNAIAFVPGATVVVARSGAVEPAPRLRRDLAIRPAADRDRCCAHAAEGRGPDRCAVSCAALDG